MRWFWLYVLSVVAANAAIRWIGFLPVWPGIDAPAGVYFVGITFTLRDMVQKRRGVRLAMLAVPLGALISAVFSGDLALASFLAFMLSESMDMIVYTRIRKRHPILAILVSNIVGLIVDSAAFLWLAFGSLDYLAGQIIGKVWMTLAAVTVIWLWKKYR